MGGFLRNSLSNGEQASIRRSDARLLMDRHAYLFGLRTVETQCTGTVRIIAPSLYNWEMNFSSPRQTGIYLSVKLKIANDYISRR